MFLDDLTQDLVPPRSAPVDVVVDRLQHQGLHRDPLAFSGGAEFGGLLVGQSQGHRHRHMIPARYHLPLMAEIPS